MDDSLHAILDVVKEINSHLSGLETVPPLVPERLPAAPGTYLLVLELTDRSEITLGRLGTFHCPAGFYLYSGSAFGPGGLRARLGRHLRGSRRARWHVDYLRAVAEPVAAGWSTAPDRLECRWAQRLATELAMPIPGAGASDCGCAGHLFHVGLTK